MSAEVGGNIYEVFYTVDQVNVWLECEIIDILSTHAQKYYKVRVTAPFQSM